MKNMIVKLMLIAIVAVACNSAMAVFEDYPELQVLMHCDEVNEDEWVTTPDDNSSGREANVPILNLSIYYPPLVADDLTIPTLMPDSPKGGSYFNFNFDDGTNDSINLDPGWRGGVTLVCDFSFRYYSLPPLPSDPYIALVSCDAFTCFLTTMENKPPHVSVMIKQNVMIQSPITVESNTWYDVGIRIINDDVSITINGSTYTEHSAFPFPDMTSPLGIGYFVRGGNRYLEGDMDEIEIGNIPEPFTFGFIGLLGLLIWKFSR